MIKNSFDHRLEKEFVFIVTTQLQTQDDWKCGYYIGVSYNLANLN